MKTSNKFNVLKANFFGTGLALSSCFTLLFFEYHTYVLDFKLYSEADVDEAPTYVIQDIKEEEEPKPLEQLQAPKPHFTKDFEDVDTTSEEPPIEPFVLDTNIRIPDLGIEGEGVIDTIFLTKTPIFEPEEDPFLPASFVGGEPAMYNFLNNNTVAPSQEISGKVWIRFVVEKDGSISNVEVIKGAHSLLNKEAQRVVGKMPNWIPAQNKNGKTVRSYFVLPFSFVID